MTPALIRASVVTEIMATDLHGEPNIRNAKHEILNNI